MDLVVDANVLFATLIKDSLTYALLFSDRFHLFTPDFVLTEFEKHKEEILAKSERTDEEFFRLLDILKRKIALVPLQTLVPYIEEAQRLTPDPDDMAYFALALKLNCAIWSNDKPLKEQRQVPIYHTHELIRLDGHS